MHSYIGFPLVKSKIFCLKHIFIMFSTVKTFFYSDPNEKLSIRKIFKPLYVVLSLFGLFPYSFKFSNKRGLVIIQKSIYINALCAVTYILTITSFLALHIQNIYNSLGENTMTREVMTQTNYVLELILSFAFCIAAYICAFSYRCTFLKIINDTANMIEPPNAGIERILKCLRLKVNVVILGFLLVVLLLQVCVNFTRAETLWKMILVFVTFMLPQQIQFTMLCFYFWLILMLLVLLMNIRIKISGITKNKNNLLDCCMKADAVLTLQYIETMFVRAFEIKRQINKAFESMMLVTTMQCFHSMVSESHIIYHGLVYESDFGMHPLINCSIWIIYQMMKIYLLARSGTLIRQEVLRIGQALHNIPIETHDIRLLLEVQHFSSLMSYQNYEITAYGLFTVDATLFSKIISSSAMYMVILMQFDKK